MLSLSFSYPHHGLFSSYHRLLAYLPPTDIVFDASMPAWMYRRALNPRGITQRCWRAWHEKLAWRHANTHKADWMHYLYPEHGYHCGKQLRRSDTKIALTCHLPQEAFVAGGERRKPFREALSIADALIVMSPNYVDFYQSLAPQAKVRFIPHGIDVEHFRPLAQKNETPDSPVKILTVGNMLRDFETLAKVIQHSVSENLDWKFQVVANKDRLEALGSMLDAQGRSKLEMLSGISDDELLAVYQKADLLYLPLTDATANNAVVEAMACGLPMILTDFPATRAYAGDSAFYVQPADDAGACSLIGSLINDPCSLKMAATACRERAKNELSWEVVMQSHIEYFAKV